MPFQSIFYAWKSDAVDHVELITKTATTKENYFFFLVFIQRRRLLGSTRENMAQHGTELFVSCIHCGRKLHGASFFFKYYSLLLSLYLCPSLFLAGLAYSIPPINILSSQERERTRGGRAQQCVVPHKEDIQNRPHKWRWKFSSVL
jgi:hypothetical protein